MSDGRPTGYINYAALNAMSEQEAAEIYDGMLDTFGRKGKPIMNGVEMIAAERQEQIEKHGYTAAEDDTRHNGGLAMGGAAYALCVAHQRGMNIGGVDPVSDLWIFPYDTFKAGDDPLKNLAKAGAMIAAEMDKIIREREKKD